MRIRVLAKMAFFGMCRTCQIRHHWPAWFARTRRLADIRQPVLLKFGEFSECRLDRFIHLKYVFVLKQPTLSCANICQGLASTCQTRQTRRHLPTCFARTRQTRRHSPTCFARTRQTLPHLPKAIFEKKCDSPRHICTSNERVTQISGECHCLLKT